MTASWQPLPPPPPPTSTPWYRRWWGVALVVVGLFLAIGVLTDDEADEPEVEVASEQITAEPEPEPAPEPEPEPEPEPTPEPEPEHDWPSERAYALDLLDSADSVAQLLGLVAEATDLYPTISNAELATIVTEAQFTLETHRSRFHGTTPPAMFQESHDLALESWDLLDESLGLFARGVRAEDPILVGEAAHLMEQGSLMMERSTAALPS